MSSVRKMKQAENPRENLKVCKKFTLGLDVIVSKWLWGGVNVGFPYIVLHSTYILSLRASITLAFRCSESFVFLPYLKSVPFLLFSIVCPEKLPNGQIGGKNNLSNFCLIDL